MQYRLADIGRVPYSKSIIAKVVQAAPYDLCRLTESQTRFEKEKYKIALLATRGNCHFSLKALNAQKLGAGMLIIADTEEETKEIFMVENDINIL